MLTGAGGAFCAGGDVKAMVEGGGAGIDYDTGGVAVQRRIQRAIAGRLHSMPKPTIASLPGAAAGAGLSLALACDLRIAARSAVVMTAFAKVGLAGDFGGTWFPTRLIGLGRARELYFLSERLSAEEAERLGIVNRVVDDERLEGGGARARGAARRGAPRRAELHEGESQSRRARATSSVSVWTSEATHHLRTALSPRTIAKRRIRLRGRSASQPLRGK